MTGNRLLNPLEESKAYLLCSVCPIHVLVEEMSVLVVGTLGCTPLNPKVPLSGGELEGSSLGNGQTLEVKGARSSRHPRSHAWPAFRRYSVGSCRQHIKAG